MESVARIVHVTEALGGGIAHSVPLLARVQAAAGHQVWVIYSRRADTPDERLLDSLLPAPIQRILVPMVREIRPFQDAVSTIALRRELKDLQPDVIHLHSSKAGALGRIATVGLGLSDQTFYSPRGLAFLKPNVGRFSPSIYRKVEALLARIAGKFIAVSESERYEICRTLGVSEVYVLENAVEIEKIPRHMPSTQRSNKLRVVTCGRIAEQKAPWRFAQLARQFEGSCDFEWLGDGADNAWLASSPVTVSGWLPIDEARKRIAEADIFVLLSLYEGMPITLIEAMVSGVPCLATNVVGNLDVIEDGVTGFLVNDVPQAAKVLERLIGQPDLRATVGAVARDRAVQRFDANLLAARSQKIYGIA